MKKAVLFLGIVFAVFAGNQVARTAWVAVENKSAAPPEIRVISEDQNQLTLTLSFPGFQAAAVEIGGETFTRLDFTGAGAWGIIGQPELPVLRRLVQLPQRAGWNWEILEEDYVEYEGYRVAPLQQGDVETPEGPRKPEPVINEAAYLQNRWIPEKPVELKTPVILRDYRLGLAEIYPIRYNPAQNIIRVCRRLTVRITFSGEGENPIVRPRRKKSKVFSDLVQSLVINPETFAADEDLVMGGYLVITPPNLENSYWLQEFVNWKRQRGYPVTVVNTNVTGTSATAITNYIEDEVYNSWEVPPDYLVLVGDNDYGMPTHYYSYTGNASDLPYTLMEGNDYFPDILAGRLSVDSESDLSIVASKTVNYERNPYMANTNWFRRGLVVFDYSGSLSCKNVKERCADLMLEYGYTEVDQVHNPPTYYGGTAINASINEGVTFVNYRGYGSYSGWTPPNYSTSNISSLSNGFKLPVITSIVCGGGNFVSTSYDPCFGEAWIRYGSSVNNPKGAVAFMGPSSLYTHTRWNNCIDGGVYQGIFAEGISDVASALLRGKMELYYGMPDNQGPGGTTSSVECYFYIYNILGDPGLQMWTDIPRYLTVSHPASLPLGVNSFSVSVSEGASAVEDALVCVYNSTTGYQNTGWTDVDGETTLDLSDAAAGEYWVTVTGRNLYPYQGTLNITQEAVSLGISNFTLDDDMIGESNGDGDGEFNPGETIELAVILENTGSSQTATGITGTVTSDDPYLTITEDVLTGPDAAPGSFSNLNDDFNLVLSPEAPHGHIVPVFLEASSAQGSWTNLINLQVVAPLAEALDWEVLNGSGVINPGEMADVTFTLFSSGGDPLENCSGILSSPDDKLVVTDNAGFWGQIAAGDSASNVSDPFTLQATTSCPPGWMVPLQLIVQADGYDDTLTVNFIVGEINDTDPTAPDAYGYRCFDSRDIGYEQIPTYDWLEVSTQAGQQTLNLPDYGTEEDCSVALALPFNFRYYGQDYDSITVCSNGWLSMGKHVNYINMRNWNIPGALGPPAMIAAFWDDLRLQYGGSVHYLYDASNHRVAVEWKNTRTATGNGTNTFEIFLYDPSYWAGQTGDGVIVFQYQDFDNADYSENYSTIGIENWEQSDGVKVTYANHYTRGSATLEDGVALLFTTDIDYSTGAPDVDITLTPYGAPIQIPASGGAFDFNIAVLNNEVDPQYVTVWCDVTLPAGTHYGPVLGPVSVTLQPGIQVDRDRTQEVPEIAPTGNYTYNAYVGSYPDIIFDSDQFTFTKVGDLYDIPYDEWSNYGEPFGEDGDFLKEKIPTETALLSITPNPFNPTTVFRYQTAAPGRVELAVYDIAGRRVALLVDGWRDAGEHSAIFDASDLASGIYLYRMQAGDLITAGKLLFIK